MDARARRRRRPCAPLALLAALAALGACDGSGGAGDGAAPGDATASGEDGRVVALPDGGTVVVPRDPPYASLLDLHERAVARTCALNNGVCHNSSAFPDLRSPSSLIASAPLPCGLSAFTPEAIPDQCEAPGDHFVIPSMGFDREVVWAEVTSVDMTYDFVTGVALEFAADLPAIPLDVRGFEVHRGAQVFPLLPTGNIRITAVAGRRITFAIDRYMGYAIESFLDVRRVPPWNESHLRVADANHNGITGNTAVIRMIEPGRPLDSYIIKRLTDRTFGELMPRQCRTWDDDATRALACWIAGLRTDETTGAITNAYDPIDYARCAVVLPAGRCASATSGSATGFAAVEAIFARSCGGPGCHVGEASPGGGLDLSMGMASASLARMSTQHPEMPLVAPGNLDGSYLFCKLRDTCDARGTTARMPSGAPPLAPDALETIRAWIAAGAPAM